LAQWQIPGAALRLKIFLVKAGRQFVGQTPFSAASTALFKKVALVKLWAGIIRPALLFRGFSRGASGKVG